MTRAAAYCRVSTDQGDQLSSFESQKLFFRNYIESRPDWSLAGIYADEGITGTTTADRTGFLEMIDDAHDGLFDVILTKEVSRFSRNILDAVAYTRSLKKIGIAVVFLNDGISTLDPDAELRLGIMASVAQEESRKTSERVKWGQQRRMERGVVFGRSLLGYDVRGGKITPEPNGAETVRLIFGMYLRDGTGVRSIAEALTCRGIPTQTGGNVWTGATVLKILRNEKYCGDLKQRKTVTTDFLTHRKVKNNGDTAFIMIRDHHEPIVSREDWEAAQAELDRRSSAAGPRHGSRYTLSGRIVCGSCRAVYLCRTRKRKNGTAYRVWTCRQGGCGVRHRQLREEDVGRCVRRFVSELDQDLLLRGIGEALTRADRGTGASSATLESEISNVVRKASRLADSYLEGDIIREIYLALKGKYDAELARLRGLRGGGIPDPDDRSAGITAVLRALASGRSEGDAFYLSLVEQIDAGSDGVLDLALRGLPGKLRAVFK